MQACVTATVLMLPAGICTAQPPAFDAEAARRQEEQWLRNEATAWLVPDPRRLAKLRGWTIDTRLHRGTLGTASLSPDATRVATGNVDGILRIWDVDSGRLAHAVIAHRWGIRHVVWSPNGELVATNSVSDNTVRVFDPKTWRTVAELPGVFDLLVWSPDSRRLAGSNGQSGRLSTSDGLEKFTLLKEVGRAITAVSWGPDGRIALAAAASGAMVIDSSDGRQQFVLEDTEPVATRMMAWSKDGTHLASVGPALAAVFEASGGKRVRELGKSGDRVAWSADGKQVAVVTPGRVSLVPFAGGEPPRQLAMPASHLLAWNPDSSQLIGVDQLGVHVWRPAGNAAEKTFPVSGGSMPPLFMPGRPLVAGLGTPVLTLWNPAGIRRTQRLEGQEAAITVAEWSPAKKVLALGDAKGSVRIRDADADERSAAGPPVTGGVRLLAWSNDGKALAAAGSRGPVQVWWPATGETKMLDGHEGPVLALAWGATSDQLATSGADEKILIWDVGAGAPRRTITDHGQATAIEWRQSPNLAVGLRESGLLLVNPGTGQLVQELIPRNRGIVNPVTGLAWISGRPPVRLLVDDSPFRPLIQAIDASSRVRYQRQLAPNGTVWASALTSGVAVTAANDRTVRFWNLDDGKLSGFLIDDGGAIAAVSASGDVAFDPEAPPDLIAIADRGDGQEWMPLDEFTRAHGWKNNPKSIRLPTK